MNENGKLNKLCINNNNVSAKEKKIKSGQNIKRNLDKSFCFYI